MQALTVVLTFLASGAGVTLLVSIGTALSRTWLDRGPRQRVAAIRAAAETADLLGPGVARTAVNAQIEAEGAALAKYLQRRERSATPSVEASTRTRVLTIVTGFVALVAGVLAIGLDARSGLLDTTATAWAGFVGGLFAGGAALLGTYLRRRDEARRDEARRASAMEQLDRPEEHASEPAAG